MKNNKNILTKIIIPAVILLVISMIAGASGLFENIGNMITVSVETIAKAIIAIVFLVVLRNILLYLVEFFRTKNARIATVANIISSMVKYATILLGFCWVLSIVGVDISTIFASIGVIALILGFGAESLVADLVTGIFILFENEYNVGDIIEVDGFRGTVKQIGMRTISLEDGGGNIKIINNSDLKNILNRSNNRSFSVCDIGVAPTENLDEIEKTFEQILEEIRLKHPDVFIGKVEYLGVEKLSNTSVLLRFTAEVNEVDIYTGRRILNKELKMAFDKHNISIRNP